LSAAGERFTDVDATACSRAAHYAGGMDGSDGDRTKFFPAIERKHGGPISSWLDRLAELGDAKYPEQVAHLREDHGFSQAHANALVMYFRGSPTSKRFNSPEGYFAAVDPRAARTAKAIFAAATEAHPELELVVAWNQPMLRAPDGRYVLGLSVATNHILVNPFSGAVLDAFASELQEFPTLKKTFKVPVDWKGRCRAAARHRERSPRRELTREGARLRIYRAAVTAARVCSRGSP
jgi:uncharacterized protein YdhG (YjbR/CyaY superfamily)